MAKLPKRTTNVKAKAKRERSWAKNQKAKEVRKAEQERRERYNREVGTTGKQRAAAARKLEKHLKDAAADIDSNLQARNDE